MGRHSAPDDDADLGLADAASDAAPATSVATAPRGRHSREAARPRPTPESAGDGDLGADGLAFLDKAFGGSPAGGAAVDVEEVTAEDVTVEDVTAGEVAAGISPTGTAPGADTAPADTAPTSIPPAPPTDVAQPVRGSHATRHDLALIMAHGDVRARALAAVLVPFVVYVVVLVVIGKLTVHSLIWVWAPAVVAGVLVGVVLDAGHRHHPTPAPDPPHPS